MFKKKCPKCDGKIGKKYEFCPFCGKNLKSEYDQEDFGFLGKNDFINENNSQSMLGGSFLDKMMNSAIKMLEKQMKDLPRELAQNPQANFNNFPKSNMKIRFMVNGKEVPINQHNTNQHEKPKQIKTEISEEKAKELIGLPRKEPKTIMKRLSEKIIYEISVPGVKEIQDILINQLENSIEIKAIAKDKVYIKTLNLNLPILNYFLKKGNLILEFQAR